MITPAAQGIWRVRAEPDLGLFVPILELETTYPPELVETIVVAKGVAYTCDEISREESPSRAQGILANDFLAYFRPKDLEGKRILDFGCGSGASTMFLARTFASCEVVGIELIQEFLDVAEARRVHYGYDNVRFSLSPGESELTSDLGQFELVVFSAVFEHLLPSERVTLLPQIWQLLRPGGYLFINQTPHRYFPTDSHTTGLPLINYLPKILALQAARRLSNRNLENDDWEILLRKGIRGATESEMIRSLGSDAKAVIVNPLTLEGSRIDLWYSSLSPRFRPVKVVCREALRVLHALTGTLLTPNITLVLKKLD